MNSDGAKIQFKATTQSAGAVVYVPPERTASDNGHSHKPKLDNTNPHLANSSTDPTEASPVLARSAANLKPSDSDTRRFSQYPSVWTQIQGANGQPPPQLAQNTALFSFKGKEPNKSSTDKDNIPWIQSDGDPFEAIV